jgi:peroxiredoxin
MALTDNIKQFEQRNVKLISIASDSNRLLKKFKEENNFKMDIIADRGAKIAKDYDVYWFAPGAGTNLKMKQAVPSKFLINKECKIVWKYIGKDKTDRPSIDLMIHMIEKFINKPGMDDSPT